MPKKRTSKECIHLPFLAACWYIETPTWCICSRKDGEKNTRSNKQQKCNQAWSMLWSNNPSPVAYQSCIPCIVSTCPTWVNPAPLTAIGFVMHWSCHRDFMFWQARLHNNERKEQERKCVSPNTNVQHHYVTWYIIFILYFKAIKAKMVLLLLLHLSLLSFKLASKVARSSLFRSV